MCSQLRLCLGLDGFKGFPWIEQLAATTERRAPVHVVGSTNVCAALAYSNHRSIASHVDGILAKILDDVRFGRAFIFLRSAPHSQLAIVCAGRGCIAV